MKRIEEVYREMLFQSMEKKNSIMSQSYLAGALKVSLSIINLALRPLRKMNAVKVNKRSLEIIDKRKIVYYWASIRNVEKDIIYKTRAEKQVRKIESEMPADILYGAYSAYKFKFKDVPADYSEVYIYSDDIKEIEKMFPKNNKPANIFILKKDINMEKMTIANIFVDLWNLKEWYAKDFLNAFEGRLDGFLE